MKANEIQIGDWVYSTFCDKPCKVVGVEQYESGYAVVKVTNVSGAKDITSLTPIPLTPEILEKNGWVRTKYAYGRDCMEIHGANELPKGVDNALYMARWSIDKNYQYHFLDLYMWKGSVMQHNVHYVHQLQHAFRIFGIEKNVEL